MRFKDIVDLAGTAAVNWADDSAQSMGASLAFYTLFSLAPMLLIVIAVAGFVFGEQAAQGEILGQLEALLGRPGATAVQDLVESAARPSESVPTAIFGLLLLFVAATSVFDELQNALDRIWRAPPKPGHSGLWRILRTRFVSFAIILCFGLVLTVALAFGALLAALSHWWGPLGSRWATIVEASDLAAGLLLPTIVFALIYKTVPRARVGWKDVWIGAAVTAILFALGKLLIGAWLGRSGIASGFGAAASLVVLLLWVYYSAQIFLLGAEFTWAFAHRFGSRRGQPMPRAGAGYRP